MRVSRSAVSWVIQDSAFPPFLIKLASSMEGLLRELNLSNLIEKFKEERIDKDAILNAIDSDLIRLGVTTIGDRIRIRELCRKSKLESGSSISSSSASSTGPFRQERLALFNPRNSRNQSRFHGSKNKKTPKPKTWTATFVCLADSCCRKTPSSAEKELLFKAGLGLKKIKLEVEDDEQTVLEKLTSDVNGEDSRPLGFPALKTCGGFEIMRCMANCRDLVKLDCCWNARDIQASLGGGQGKLYLVPIQKSISTKPLKTSNESELMETCKLYI